MVTPGTASASLGYRDGQWAVLLRVAVIRSLLLALLDGLDGTGVGSLQRHTRCSACGANAASECDCRILVLIVPLCQAERRGIAPARAVRYV